MYYKKLHKLTLNTIFLAFLVILLGAYTRLKDAGLGCPDWPGCYGQILVPSGAAEPSKAWIEMIHRYFAGALGLLIFFISYLNIKKSSAYVPTCILISTLVILQGLLGMWTVTLKLYPVVVMGHLIGGLTIFSLLNVLYLQQQSQPKAPTFSAYNHMAVTKFLAYSSLIVLILQIILGGWVSANYAAIVCQDFPTCQGQLWPKMNWQLAFNFKTAGIFDSPGTPLDNQARLAIHMAHRIGAIIATIIITALSINLWRSSRVILRNYAIIIFVLLTVQIILGISNILAGHPLSIAILHNAVATLLLATLIHTLFKIKRIK